MNWNVFIFITCCFLCVLPFIAYNYDSAENARIFLNYEKTTAVDLVRKFETVHTPIKVDVFKLCEKICDRQNQSCVDPAISVLVYSSTLRQIMTFEQNFKTFLPKVEVEEVHKEALVKKWKHKRTLCPVNDLDPSFETMTREANCAIIGNSGILLGSECGKDIDAHDFVLRANLAQLNGYTDDVGNKTSMMMINVAIVRKLHNILTNYSDGNVVEKENMLRYFQSIQRAILWYPKSTGSGISKKLQEIATVLIKENVTLQFAFSFASAAGLSKRKWKTEKLPSSGLIALTVAQSFCKNITLYGFYPYQYDSSGARILHHYFEPNRTSFHTDVHNFDEEYNLLGSLHDKHLLRRVVGPCKMKEMAQLHYTPPPKQSQTKRPPVDQNQTKKSSRDQSRTGKPQCDQNQTECNSFLIRQTPTPPFFRKGSTSNCSSPVGNIVFVKTHKTGSTTVRGILNRYGLFNNLSFLLRKDQSAGHIFSDLSTISLSRFLPPLGIQDGDLKNYKGYNISNTHVRFNTKRFGELMNPDSYYITILRHPVEQWFSAFQYFHVANAMSSFINLTVEDPVGEFLQDPKRYRTVSPYAWNNQIYDLGVSSSHFENPTYMQRKIDQFSQIFDLVLITEYFDESLVVLKRLLCWTFDDILYVKMRAQPVPLTVSSEIREKIWKLNNADVMLYTHFNRSLWTKIDAYGEDFEKDLEYFRKYENEKLEECVKGKKVVKVAGNHLNVMYTFEKNTPSCKTFVNHATGNVMRAQQNKG